MSWYLYLLECEDGSIYTGITNDVEKRFAAHQAGKGARFTRARGARRILATRRFRDRAAAARAEYATKQLNREEKEALCARLSAKRKARK